MRDTRSLGLLRCRSKYHTRLQGPTGYTLLSGIPGICHDVAVSNFTYTTAGNALHTTPSGAGVSSAISDQPTTRPLVPLRMPRFRSKWSVARTGMPTHNGNTPYSLAHRTLCRVAATIAISPLLNSASPARPRTMQHLAQQINMLAFVWHLPTVWREAC